MGIAPKGERLWTTYYNERQELLFILTSKENSRDFYYLYRVGEGEKLTKLGKARSPRELEEKFAVHQQMRNERT